MHLRSKMNGGKDKAIYNKIFKIYYWRVSETKWDIYIRGQFLYFKVVTNLMIVLKKNIIMMADLETTNIATKVDATS